MDVSNGIVIALGLGIVFAGLICLVIICSLLGAICKVLVKPEEKSAPSAAPVASGSAPIANKQELVAAICAAIAEDLGTDASNIRVVSFKKI